MRPIRWSVFLFATGLCQDMQAVVPQPSGLLGKVQLVGR
jgi:hypothetical protein